MNNDAIDKRIHRIVAYVSYSIAIFCESSV